MPFFINRNFENQLFEYFASMQAWNNVRPINLGGVSNPSGTGGPPGGFIGQLPQNRVTYDYIEANTWTLPASGISLINNLNRIRHRITVLEGVGSGISGIGTTVQLNDTIVGSGVTILNFEGDVSVIQNSPGKVTITISASGIVYTHQTIFTAVGTLTVGNNPLRVYNKLGVNQTISEVFLSVGTAPTGSGIVVDIHKGGTTIFTNQTHRPQIIAGANTGNTTTIDISSWGTNEYLTAHIDNIGSATAGSDLVIHVIHT
jgi:hypothetical protein